MNICGLILAAGGSTRLGRPKQLVQANGQSLLEQSINNALAIPLEQIYVVLGAHFEQVETNIKHLPVSIIKNEQWQEGIGSSISTGIRHILCEGNFDAVLIMLCDQLHVNTIHLQALVKAFKHKEASIIATAYGDQIGVPALFDQQYFTELAKLSDDIGAKKILQHADSMFSISFEKAIIDIDTPEDLIKTGLIE